MSGSLTHGGGENVPFIPGACATRNFAYLVRGPWHEPYHWYRKIIQTLSSLHRDHSRFVPSQWETALLCNDVSHWLSASLKSALLQTLKTLSVTAFNVSTDDKANPITTFPYQLLPRKLKIKHELRPFPLQPNPPNDDGKCKHTNGAYRKAVNKGLVY